MDYTFSRPRRLRKSALLRDFSADVRLDLSDFIMPIFLREGRDFKNPISSMPDIFQLSPDLAFNYIKNLTGKGLRQFILFGVTEKSKKDAQGSFCLNENSPVNETLRRVKEANLPALMIADACFCEYTDHGHCGILSENQEEVIDNDKSLKILSEQAVFLAKNGADIIAPSGMLDGMVKNIRLALDKNKFHSTAIMSYSTKFSSALYGPFREAGEGAPTFGDRKAYQMDFRRRNEWKLETMLDIEEGADMLMVKPGLLYLDILKQVADVSPVPVGAYHVSGEYSMIHAAAEKGWVDLKQVALESSYAFKRAGAKYIISYFSDKMTDWLKPLA